jgi:spore cortex formation protein SpoVR/YcgB (stage V sporulation)
MRKMRMFEVRNDASEPEMMVEAIHNERGYRKLRKALARQYDIGYLEPDIQIVDVDLAGDRKLILQHRVINRVLLDESDARAVLRHIANLWGYEVMLVEVDATTDAVLKEHTVSASSLLLS